MILEEETYKKFGYYPSDLKPKSNKKILVACDGCGKVRMITRKNYRSLCFSCARKGKCSGEKNIRWKGGKIKCVCQYCGNVFETHNAWIKKGGGIFCNNKCKYKWRSENIREEKHPRYGKHHTKETKRKLCKARKHRKFPTYHTKPELIFEAICKKSNLPFKYTGNGSFWIQNINLDFIDVNGKKIVVEIFGDYWHSPLLKKDIPYNQTYEGRKKILKKYGWKLIVFWESDLKRKDAEQFVLLELSKYAFLPSF